MALFQSLYRNREDYIKITPAKDILDLAGKYKPIKKKPVLKAREEMERFYRRF